MNSAAGACSWSAAFCTAAYSWAFIGLSSQFSMTTALRQGSFDRFSSTPTSGIGTQPGGGSKRQKRVSKTVDAISKASVDLHEGAGNARDAGALDAHEGAFERRHPSPAYGRHHALGVERRRPL